MDKSCVEDCPVDCIYEGDRKLYINPRECIDCGACEPDCPETAIFTDIKPPAGMAGFAQDNQHFFAEPLPGRGAPIGNPGGSAKVGPSGPTRHWSRPGPPGAKQAQRSRRELSNPEPGAEAAGQGRGGDREAEAVEVTMTLDGT